MSPHTPAYRQFRSYTPPFADTGDTPYDPRISIYARRQISERVWVREWLDFSKIEVVA
mgnify:CR=1 FL=1